MPALSTALRNQLAGVIKQARSEAEAGARNALEFLAVSHYEPHGSMTPDERGLRNRLRAHGRQLGDVRDKANGRQSIDRLVHEVAYEYWHRMLFARFLAENGLLIDPESRVPISMEECEELAREAGENPHSMAARFAQGSLPQIFRVGDPALEVPLATNHRQALDQLLDSLPPAVFTAQDSLGWTYQYWQAEKKDAVNEAGNKIGADELPAVTQLFTEHYMVLSLYHNTIGAWYAGRLLAANPSLAETAENEQELRDGMRLGAAGGYDFDYLRFVRTAQEDDAEGQPSGPWRPAAGTFAGWPKTAKELTVLDPCCGSGHFLIEGFELLVRLRMDEEGIGLEDAIRLVIANNLHGLELDPRCTQIAAFNLALAAWKLAGSPIELPSMQIACSGLALGSTKAEWGEIAGSDARAETGMERLYELFEEAPTLGSLLDPRSLASDLYDAGFEELQPLMDAALAKGTADAETVEIAERAVAAKGMTEAAALMAGRYTLVITNVPYLGRGQQDAILKSYAEEVHPEAKNDLATMFVERMLRWPEPAGSVAAVTPQNWLFLSSYETLRKKLLTRRTWNFVARLGPKGFRTPMWDFNVMLLTLSAHRPSEAQVMGGIDVSNAKNAADKATLLRGDLVEGLDRAPDDFAIGVAEQKGQLGNPDARVLLADTTSQSFLSEYASASIGLHVGDWAAFRRGFWEVIRFGDSWRTLHNATVETRMFSGGENILYWPRDGEMHRNNPAARVQGQPAWGRGGVCVSLMADLPATIYGGGLFRNGVAAIVPTAAEHLPAVWAYCSSSEFHDQVRVIDQKLYVTCGTLVKVPFDLERWQKVAAEKYPNGLPEPSSDDPTQWFFHGHPAEAEPHTVLQVAVGRLLGYRWPPEFDPEMRLADEARAWVRRCDALLAFADDDGIVCLEATRGEPSACGRLRALLEAAFGDAWSTAKERELLAAIAAEKSTEKKTVKPATSIEDWLRDDFFREHNKLFRNRPFVWHLWDGQKRGFHCLANAHKLNGPDGEGQRTLKKITYDYLGDWIARQKSAVESGREGADALLAAAQHLQGELERILEGEPPYDLFVRWKPLREQPIGWQPDINDGVRLNIRPFMSATLLKGGKKGAGILRAKPNIKWTKDRGKEPKSLRPRPDFPWFWSCQDGATGFPGGDTFDGNRWNDLHYSLGAKQAARKPTLGTP